MSIATLKAGQNLSGKSHQGNAAPKAGTLTPSASKRK